MGHVIALPLVLLLLVVLHLAALHEVGSNNPDGVEIKALKKPDGTPLDGIAFHPYYTVKDIFGTGFFLVIAAFIIFYAPTFGGWFLEHDNFIPANNLVTPTHIKPVWYFTPFYAIVRMIPAKLPGVLAMFGSIAVLFFFPWLDRARSSRSVIAVWVTRSPSACSRSPSSCWVRLGPVSPPS